MKVTEAEQAKIIEYYLACESMRKTAIAFNRDGGTIKRVLKRFNISTDERKGKSNICILCKRADHFITYPCPWASRFEAVPGWTAQKIERIDSGAKVETYEITKCPLFMKDDKRRVSK